MRTISPDEIPKNAHTVNAYFKQQGYNYKINRSNECYFFTYSDGTLPNWPETTIYTNRASDRTVQSWINELKHFIEE